MSKTIPFDIAFDKHHLPELEKKWVYRYTGASVNDDLTVEEYQILRETVCGYWIDLGYGEQMWIGRGGKKHFAYPTKREALISFLKRKIKHVYHAERSLSVAKSQLRMAQLAINPMTKSELADIMKYTKRAYTPVNTNDDWR